MKTLVLLALVGLGAQLVDGSLGMAYGVTSTTLLLAIGTNPAAASATVHLAEIGTTLTSGPRALEVRQRRLEGRRQDRRARARSAPSPARPFLVQPLHRGRRPGDVADPAHPRRLHPGPLHPARASTAGTSASRCASASSARWVWSPASSTPPAAAAGARSARRRSWPAAGWSRARSSARSTPREFLVALAASLGFLLALGSQGVDFTWVAVLLVGGLIAAPIAAWLVRHIPPRLLGSLVGGMIVLTNTRTLLQERLDRRRRRHALRRLRGASTLSGPPRSCGPSASTARTRRWSPPTRSPPRPSRGRRGRASSRLDAVAERAVSPAGPAPRATEHRRPRPAHRAGPCAHRRPAERRTPA